MVDIVVHGGQVGFIVRGWHRVWALRRRVVVPQVALAVELRNHRFARLVVEVGSPEAVLRRLQRAAA
jgi:hypothetical protein